MWVYIDVFPRRLWLIHLSDSIRFHSKLGVTSAMLIRNSDRKRLRVITVSGSFFLGLAFTPLHADSKYLEQ